MEEDKIIWFKIDGECVPKGRPRFRNVGDFVKTYSPKENITYENYVRMRYLATNDGVNFMNKEPLFVKITIYKAVPKSISNKRCKLMIAGNIKPTKKPDVDNCAKSILDSLNKIAFADDSQVCSLWVVKRYAYVDYTTVEIKEMKEDELE